MNRIDEVIAQAKLNASKCRTLKWGNTLAIGAYGPGSKTHADITTAYNLPADDGVVVIEWSSMAGYDDDPMSQGGYIALRPHDGAMINQRAWSWSDRAKAVEFAVARNHIAA